MAIGVGVATALLASVAFQFLIPGNDSGLSPWKKTVSRLPMRDTKYIQFILTLVLMNSLMMISSAWNIWINCGWKNVLPSLPTESIISIANNVERDVLHGE